MNEFNVQHEISKSGMPTLKINNLYVHSKYDPIKEAKQFVEKNFKPATVQVLIGYGLGYIYNELEKKLENNEKIIVFDHISDIPSDVVSEVSHEQSEIQTFIKSNVNVTDTYEITIAPNFSKIDASYCKEILATLSEIIKVHRVSENTTQFFSNSWHQNYLKNLPYSFKDQTLAPYQNLYDCPIVVVASGPSVTKQLPLLKEYRNKIIVIAAGTTINVLLKNDITPDYVISMDGTITNYNHFKDVDTSNLTLVYDFTQHPGIRPLFDDSSIVFNNMMELEIASHLNQYKNPPIDGLFGGSSVATFAYSLALMLTTNTVALIGQDLAYTNNQTHASTNLNSKNIDEAFKKKRNAFETEGYYGDVVLTDDVFIHMKSVFEDINEDTIIRKRSFNCTEGGIKIRNFNQKSFNDFLNEYTNENVEKKTIDAPVHQNDISFLVERLEEDVTRYETIIDLLESTLKALKNNRLHHVFEDKILKKLNKNDEKIQKISENLSLKTSFSHINLLTLKYYGRVANETREEAYKRVYNQNEFLYGSMKKVTEEDIVCLKETINKLKEKVK